MFTVNELIKATGGKFSGPLQKRKLEGISTDTRALKDGEVFIAIKGDNFDGHDFIRTAAKRAGLIIAQRPVKFKTKTGIILVKDTVKALGAIARLHRDKFSVPLIAVSGSNGKTTTKEMIACLLGERYNVLKNQGTKNNHIGLPLTLLELNSRHEIIVVEVGTNHFGEIAYLSGIALPEVAVITNIGPAHLESFKDLAGVLREKRSLLDSLSGRGSAVLNADDPYLSRLIRSAFRGKFILGFGLKKRADFRATSLRATGGGYKFKLNGRGEIALPLLGAGNVYNALSAIAVAKLFGLSNAEINKGFSKLAASPGRLNLLKQGGVSFIDDTYNANPASLGEALKTVGNLEAAGRKICVIGDMLELGDAGRRLHCEAGQAAASVCDVILAVGRLSRYAAKAAKACGFDTKNLFTCDSSLEAGKILKQKIVPASGDVVLVKGSRGMKMEKAIDAV